MADTLLFPEEPADTRTAIMKATFEALSKHGYANLTIKRISEEFPKSESLLYHHYEGKDELLLEFLSYLLEQFEEREIPACIDGDPETQLRTFFDHILAVTDDQQNYGLVKVLIELRVQASQDPDYRDHFTQTREHFRNHVSEIIRNGVESGAFRDVDPDRVASFLMTIVSGNMFDYVTTDESAPIRSEIDYYIECRLLADGADE